MESALAVASNRPNEGEWSSPLQRQCNFDEDDKAELDFDMNGMTREDTDKLLTEELKSSPYLVEQLTHAPGGLPAPLPSCEREFLIRSMKPTATYEMLSQIPSEILLDESEDGQALRRKLLDGATIVFFSAGYPGKKFSFEIAARLGVKAVVLDSPDSWAKELVAEGIIAKFIPIDMNQESDCVYRDALNAIKALENEPLTGPADGVCTFVELSVPIVSRLAEALGLPGPAPSVVDAARDKYVTRKVIEESGLPAVASYLIESVDDLPLASKKVGFPAVLKPVSGAASLGVKKVESEEELESVFNEITALMRELVVSSGALERIVRTTSLEGEIIPLEVGNHLEAAGQINTTLMLEEYLDGQEVDLDLILSRGECTYAEMHDNGPTLEPYFAETWGCLPSLLPEPSRSEMVDFLVECTRALGFTEGLFHVEGKMTSRGPRLIEVNARMGGGCIWFIHKARYNVDLVAEALQLAVGIPSKPVYDRKSKRCIGYTEVNATKTGMVRNLDFLEKFERQPDIIRWLLSIQPFEEIIGPEHAQPSWLVDLAVEADSPRKAAERIQELDTAIALEFEKYME